MFQTLLPTRINNDVFYFVLSCNRASQLYVLEEGLSLFKTVAKRIYGNISKLKNLLEIYQIRRQLFVKLFQFVCFC